MKPLAAVREYYYWSDRLVAKVWDDNVERLPAKINISAGVSNFGIQALSQESLQTKAARAAAVEQMLVDHVVVLRSHRWVLDALLPRSTQ